MATHVDTPRRTNIKDDSVVFLRQKQLSDIRNVQVEPENSKTKGIFFTSPQHSYLITEEDLHAMPSGREIGATEPTFFPQTHSSQNSCNAKPSDRCPTNESNKTQNSTAKTVAEITQIFRVSPTEENHKARTDQVEVPRRVDVSINGERKPWRRSASKKNARLVGWVTSSSPSQSHCESLKTETQIAWAGTKGLTLFLLVICTVSLSGNVSLLAMVSTDSSMTSELKMYVMVETATDVAILISAMCVIAWLLWESFRRIFPQEEEHKSCTI